MRYAGGLWHLPRLGRQGKTAKDLAVVRLLTQIMQSLFAYHIEALVPSNPQSQNSSRTPQKLNGTRDVQFFTVGNLNGRTLVIYMKKKGVREFDYIETSCLTGFLSKDRQCVPRIRACDRKDCRES
jgi:hypothetical protein